MNKAWEKLKQSFEENPLGTIFVCTLAANAAAKVLHEVIAAKNSRTYAKEIDRRTRKY